MDKRQPDVSREPKPGKPGGEPTLRPPASNVWMMVLVLVLVMFLLVLFNALGTQSSPIPYSFFRSQLDQGNVAEVEFSGEGVTGKWKTPPNSPDSAQAKPLPKEFTTVLPPVEDRELIPLLEKQGVKYRAERTSWGQGVALFMYLLGPMLLLVFLWIMLRRSADPMSGSGVFGSFGRSPAKRFTPTAQNTTFDDVANMDHAKGELQEVVEFLKNPSKFQRLGATIPKGILLMGPPGTGKTLLARATAGEAGVAFFSINGSEFIQMFVGVGASRVRDLFRTAKELSPCLIFIDEIDAVGRIRGAGFGGGHDEREQTLNQILSEMDGFQQNEAIIVIAATNRPDVLDPALLRPGRFDRHVAVDRPNRAGRLAVLKVHCRKVPLSPNVNLDQLAASTIGFSGADIRNLVNEAALNATRLGKDVVEGEDFEQARDKVLMGPKREEILTEHEKEMTSYHESGHALLAWLLPEVDPVHKVTIIPRGRALGVTQLLPDEEHFSIGENRLHSQLTFIMGGRAAEKLVFDEYTAGAEDDLKRATQLARRMVGHWGMSDVIGPVSFRQGEEHPFLGKEIHEMREFSEETARIIDEEVQKFLMQAAERATRILTEHRDKLDRLAQRLLEQEVLGQDEIIELLGIRAERTLRKKLEAAVRTGERS
jgi:cell division protease FtsH